MDDNYPFRGKFRTDLKKYPNGLPHYTDICRCSVCGWTFASTAAFDAHRVGRYTPNERRCLSETEMREKGMVENKRGLWVTKPYGGHYD